MRIQPIFISLGKTLADSNNLKYFVTDGFEQNLTERSRKNIDVHVLFFEKKRAPTCKLQVEALFTSLDFSPYTFKKY